MLLAELGANDDEIEVIATDLNPAAVDRARFGEFPARRMSGVSPQRRDRFFDPCSEGFRVRPSISRRVHFSVHNLANPLWGDLGISRGIDLILCRNVIIYFGIETIRRVMDRFQDVLRPDGYLFLGYSESLFKVYDRFRMVEVDGTFVYRPASAVPVVAVQPPPRPGWSTTSPGFRLSAIVRPPRPVESAPSPAAIPAPARAPEDRIREVTQEIEKGGFGPAREKLERWLVQDPDQLGALLTLGNLYGLTGDPGRARECFERVLAKEPLCADAHVFGSLAAFQAGQLDEARTELTRALFLEPTLAIAHYLLAQVLERGGDRVGARRSYRNAISQLRATQRPLAGYYPDSPEPEAIGRAARYALAALEERGG
jgi:chemotaxis protein methyltransferase CheR